MKKEKKMKRETTGQTELSRKEIKDYVYIQRKNLLLLFSLGYLETGNKWIQIEKKKSKIIK